MQRVIIADTSCLILLSKINHFDLLQKLFGEIYITSFIAKEFQRPLPDWVLIKDPKEPLNLRLLKIAIDEGEASAIGLSLEMENALLILDDNKARKLALKLNLNIPVQLAFYF
jgi:predicted nucleic acid-binding protein